MAASFGGGGTQNLGLGAPYKYESADFGGVTQDQAKENSAKIAQYGLGLAGGSGSETFAAPQMASSGGAEYPGTTNAGYAPSGGSNPYLTNYADATAKQAQQNFLQSVMPQIRSGAMASGQYGGSRQGIAEGVAAGNAAVGLGATNANAGLQQQSLDNNFYLGNRNLDLSQYQIGANLYDKSLTGQTTLGKGDYDIGDTFLNAPMKTLNQYSNLVNPYTGLNNTNTGTNSSGGGLTGAIGGGMTAAKLIALLSSGDPTTLKNLGLSS